MNGERLEEPYVPAQFRDERSMSEMTVPDGRLLCAGRPPESLQRQPRLWRGGARGNFWQGGFCLLAGGMMGKAALGHEWRAEGKTAMRLAIFGGTGGTGLELTRQALEKGHRCGCWCGIRTGCRW